MVSHLWDATSGQVIENANFHELDFFFRHCRVGITQQIQHGAEVLHLRLVTELVGTTPCTYWYDVDRDEGL